MKKYELTNETKIYYGRELRRIKALRDFGNVKAGDLGGWIEKEDNLSHEGDCWVYDEAMVFDNAEVFGEARVYGNARVYGDASVYGKSNVCADAVINQNMRISFGVCKTNLSKDLKESIRCQTGLGVFNNKVIAYKQVRKDLRSFYDSNFKYEIGKYAIVRNTEISSNSCSSGLYFSNMNYWNEQEDIENSTFIMAEIDLEDIITVQYGKIRCKKAKILGKYDIEK